MKILFPILFLTTSIAFAAKTKIPTVNCQIISSNGKKTGTHTKMKTPHQTIDSSSRGLNVGDENYTYSLNVDYDGTKDYYLNLIVFENKVVQDELTELNCTLNEDSPSNCVKEIFNSNDMPVARVSCELLTK